MSEDEGTAIGASPSVPVDAKSAKDGGGRGGEGEFLGMMKFRFEFIRGLGGEK
jgi:hypothetical protein